MQRRTLLSILGGAFLLASIVPLSGYGESTSQPRTLESHELWQVRAGDPFLCCAFMEECESDKDCMDKDGESILCRAYRDWLEVGVNTDSCAQSPNQADECENSLQTDACLEAQACMVIFSAGVPICVNEGFRSA